MSRTIRHLAGRLARAVSVRLGDAIGRSASDKSADPVSTWQKEAKVRPSLTRRDECLRILELHSGATEKDVTAAFRKLSRTYHPDRFANGTSEERRVANELFLEIKAAYEWLTANGVS